STESYEVIGLDDYIANPSYSRFDGSGYSIAILDTGADLDHPSLANRIVYQQDFADGDMNANDVHGHGTNVAGIVAGAAPGVNLIILKVFEDGGDGHVDYVEQALQWVVANAAPYNIISVNMSLGDGGNYQSNQA